MPDTRGGRGAAKPSGGNVGNGNEYDKKWNEKYHQLKIFKEKNGHCNVPSRFKDNKSLANWVHNQRKVYKNNTLSERRIQLLQEIGFVWSPLDEIWDEKFKILMEYKAENGHCSVSSRFKHDGLGTWVMAQRKQYKEGDLPTDRIGQLEGIGFVWRPKTGPQPKRSSGTANLSNSSESEGSAVKPKKKPKLAGNSNPSSSDTQNSTVISDSEGRSSEKEWEVDSVGRNEVLNLKHELEQIKSENEVLKADKEKIVKRIELMMKQQKEIKQLKTKLQEAVADRNNHKDEIKDLNIKLKRTQEASSKMMELVQSKEMEIPGYKSKTQELALKARNSRFSLCRFKKEKAAEMKSLRESNEHLKESIKCPVCYRVNEEDMYVIVGCGHRICGTCSRKLVNHCHICRAILPEVGWLQKIYLG